MKRGYWRGLLYTMAVVLAIPPFGLVGALIAGGLLTALWKWPKARTITASVLIAIFFVSVVLLGDLRRSRMSQVAVVPTTPATGAGTNSTDQWARDANAFEAAHPDIKFGQNEHLVQEKINEIANPAMGNGALLQEAYDIALLDPHWTHGSPTPTSAQPNASTSTPLTYFQTVTRDWFDCQQKGGNQADCLVKASPKRCTQAALTFIGSVGSNALELNRHVWAICVNSCQAASTWSKLAGDCHRG